MAKPKDESNSAPQVGGRSFKADTGKFDSIVAGESITGMFIGAKDQEIMDQRTRQPKTLFVLKLRGEGDRIIKLPCAAMLRQTWDDIVDEYGEGDEQKAIAYLRGRKMTINRGQDVRTKDNNPMGTYEIIVY